MHIKNINEELMPIYKSITVLNVVEKLSEIIEHPFFVKDKFHIKTVTYFLNDDEIYVERLEPFLISGKPYKSFNDLTMLEVVLILSSSFLFLFEEFLNQNEKKMLIVKFIDILESDDEGDLRLENCIEAVKFLVYTLHAYQSQNLHHHGNNLENIAFVNQILDLLNNSANNLITMDDSAHDLFEKQKKYYNEKKEYFRDKYFIEKEQNIKSDKTEDEDGDDNNESYAKYTNIFNKTIPISDAVNHFKIFTTAKSKNGKPFLTEKQFDNFIRKAFCGESNIPKQKFNMVPKGEKFIIQHKFRQFYEKKFDCFPVGKVQDIFVRLLTDNFTGWEFENVKANFIKSPKKPI